MEREGSLPHSQAPATCPYPEPDRSSPSMPRHATSGRYILILSSQLPLGLPSGLPSGFPTKTLYALLLTPIRASCPTSFSRLDLITRVKFDEFLLCSLLNTTLSSSLLDPDILLSAVLTYAISRNADGGIKGWKNWALWSVVICTVIFDGGHVSRTMFVWNTEHAVGINCAFGLAAC